jgi:UDP-galactopyranose mutase
MITEKMLQGSDVKLNVDYFADRDYFNSIADKIVYTGALDEYYDYRFG